MQRRNFIKNSLVISSGSLIFPSIVKGKLAASQVQLGIIGCGNRGTAVITSMSANANVNIVAMADIFEDKLKAKHSVYNALNAAKGLPAIKASNMYKGADAYRKLLQNKEVDAVLISSPCFTHPEFLEAAIQAGKHVYCEKPLAVDVAGVKRAENAAKGINNKSITIGFQIRHASPYAEMVKRIHDGQIGDVVIAQLYYLSSRNEKVQSVIGSSDTEMKIRNHFHFLETSGGILLDQGIHMLDVCNWALRNSPVSAMGAGGRSFPDDFGNNYSHYEVIYKYPKNINVTMQSTQSAVFGDVCARFIGTKGTAEAHYSGGVFINGDNKWDSGVAKDASSVSEAQRAAGVFLSSLHDADKNKGSSFIKSIESGKYINEVSQGAASTLTAILGRQAAEKSGEVGWKAMLDANEKLDAKLDLKSFI